MLVWVLTTWPLEYMYSILYLGMLYARPVKTCRIPSVCVDKRYIFTLHARTSPTFCYHDFTAFFKVVWFCKNKRTIRVTPPRFKVMRYPLASPALLPLVYACSQRITYEWDMNDGAEVCQGQWPLHLHRRISRLHCQEKYSHALRISASVGCSDMLQRAAGCTACHLQSAITHVVWPHSSKLRHTHKRKVLFCFTGFRSYKPFGKRNVKANLREVTHLPE